MKRILIPTLFAIGSTYIAAGALQAQTQVIYANVPFDFQTDRDSHAAGKYRLEQPSNLHVVLLENVKGMTTSNLGIASNGEETKGSPKLVFHRYGNQYFLAEVWGTRSQMKKMPISRAERNIRNGETRVQAAVVTVSCETVTGF